MALLVTVVCVLLLAFMRAVGAISGSRTAGTIAGIGLVTLPFLIFGAAALFVLTGGLAVIIAVALAGFALYRKICAWRG